MNDRIKTKWILLTLWCAGLSLTYGAEPVKNIIFMIGDGMGYEQVRAAALYNGAPLCFETFPYTGQQTTLSDGGAVTDSAAGGTALATGVTVVNNVLSMRIPGDKSRLETILEYIQKRGRRTGLVTTVPMTHATPAAFGAHVTNRTNTTAIAYEYLNISRPNVLLGGGRDGMTPASAIAAGYTVVTNVSGLLAVNPNTIEFLSGQFIAPDGSGYSPYEATGIGSWPHLSQMTATALDLLDNDPDGFFLMVEGGKIDYAGHASQLPHLIGEVLEFHNAVAVVTNWAAGRTDTLILVTADHETGGLSVQADNGAGNLPTVSWGGGGQHTASNVPVYAWGPAGSYVNGLMNNTRHFSALTESMLVKASNVTMTVKPSGAIDVSGSVVSGAVYRLDSRTSLVHGAWAEVQMTTSASPVMVMQDTNTAAGVSRFYRLISLP